MSCNDSIFWAECRYVLVILGWKFEFLILTEMLVDTWARREKAHDLFVGTKATSGYCRGR
jgi:hypothetical protein